MICNAQLPIFIAKRSIMMKHINRSDTEEFYTDERCHICELLNDDASPQLSMARCRVERGTTTQLHALDQTEEVYFIEQGSGIMEDGAGNQIEVNKGDSIKIPQNHPQRIRNTGPDDLVFLVICRPRFRPECYLNLEE